MSSLGMLGRAGKRRLGPILNQIAGRFHTSPVSFHQDHVRIGDVVRPRGQPGESAHLVPRLYCADGPAGTPDSQFTLGVLRWLMQKDGLGQDIFLVGPPGPLRRHMALRFCGMLNRETEYIAVTRDTTESDIKQRREIRDKTVLFNDQPAVTAAVNGHCLIFEGIEKAERNILPIINNLLENRELNLDDGTTLVSHKTYDHYIESGQFTKKELDAAGIRRVHPDFRVIALGLPVPQFDGNSLDPPLRSRFQALSIVSLPVESKLSQIAASYPGLDLSRLQSVLSFSESIKAMWASDDEICKSLRYFPDNGVDTAARLLNQFTYLSLDEVLRLVYPTDAFALEDNVKERAYDAARKFQFSGAEARLYSFKQISDNGNGERHAALATFVETGPNGSNELTLQVTRGPHGVGIPESDFVVTGVHDRVLTRMMMLHSANRDMCLLGEKGWGKTLLVRRMARLLGYDMQTMNLYKDMSARDLLQRRATDLDGNTIYVNTPLTEAAISGQMAVLDGVDKLPSGSISAISRLVQDREIRLLDDTTLVSAERYEDMLKDMGEAALQARKVIPIHPSFRIIALGGLPDTENDWLNDEVLSLFSHIAVEPLNVSDKHQILDGIFSGHKGGEGFIEQLIQFENKLRALHVDDPALGLPASLSTRQLVQLCSRQALFPGTEYDSIARVLLARFLPLETRKVLNGALKDCGIDPVNPNVVPAPEIEILGDNLRIGDLEVPVCNDANMSRVPNILFYDTNAHRRVLHDMVRDLILCKQHILLIGNQGVGKNKLADRLCQLMKLEREYQQLHRDTTVQSLTASPSVREGVLEWVDSPLVTAVRTGRVLMLDEADKAPLEVVTVLKGLVDGEMHLPDGRKILSMNLPLPVGDSEDSIIRIHPDFKMIVLANRPGFPFLGNDFYRECGDLFSCHSVDNLDRSSEIDMLKQYGPNVPEKLIKKLTAAFDDIRQQVDSGVLAYPYSTREIVNIVKHLQEFPKDISRLENVFENVFSFDAFDPEVRRELMECFKRHNLPIMPASEVGIRPMDFGSDKLTLEMGQRQDFLPGNEDRTPTEPKHGKEMDGEQHVGGNQWSGGSGGADTAGLGGVGGPYRLDGGHPVHQVSDEQKANVSAEVLEAARQMNREAFKKRLEEIQMSEYDHNIYGKFYGAVSKEISQLRVILSAVEAKNKDRVWMKHQTSGDFDDAKVVDSVVGDRTVYKRRDVDESNNDRHQKLPKRIKFVMDVSGSMYRFNGMDQRLNRLLETTVLVMEGLQGFEKKYEYSIVGHSGESPEVPFVEFGSPPKNENERFKIIQTMFAHTQYCWSGDTTLTAIEKAVKSVKEEEADDYYVFAISDANLQRYGIKPSELSKVLLSDKTVKSHCFFVGSMGNEAAMLQRALPRGIASVCLDTSRLPFLFKHALTHDVAKAN